MPNYTTYPAPHVVHGVRDYIEHGVPPGHFLTAVLENDLREACARADEINQRLIFETVAWLWNEAPAICWGSPERVAKWLRLHAEVRERQQQEEAKWT